MALNSDKTSEVFCINYIYAQLCKFEWHLVTLRDSKIFNNTEHLTPSQQMSFLLLTVTSPSGSLNFCTKIINNVLAILYYWLDAIYKLNITEYRIPRMDNATFDRDLHKSYTVLQRTTAITDARYLRNSWASCTQFHHCDEYVSYEKHEYSDKSDERLTDSFRIKNTRDTGCLRTTSVASTAAAGQWYHREVIGATETYVSVTKWVVLY